MGTIAGVAAADLDGNGSTELAGPASQSRDYFDAAEELDRRWEELKNGRS